LSERDRRLVIDDPARRGFQGLVPQIPLARPADLRRPEVARPSHPAGPEVAGLRHQRGEEMAGVIGAPRRGSAGVRELACEAGPAVNLDQQVGQVDDRQLIGDLLCEIVDVGLTRLGPQALDAEVALLADRHVSLVGPQSRSSTSR
jgi:hypothetical protein